MARVPNWGPSAGQPVPDDQWDAYMAANPPPEGASFSAGPAAQPEGQERATLGKYAGDEAAKNALLFTEFYRPAQQGIGGDPYWNNYFNAGMSAPGVQMPGFQTGNQDQARLEQQKVIQALQQQARGDLNSLAQQQLQRGYGQARAQQSSLGSTMRGQGAGAAMRGIQQGQQGIQRGYAGDQQMLMLQEQQAAQALLAQMLQQQQGQDITQAGGMANTQLQGDALNQAMQQFYTQGNIQQQLGNYQYGSDYLRSTLGFDLEAQNLAQQQTNQALQTGATALTTAMNAWGGGKQQPSGYRQVDGQNSIVPTWDK